MTHIRLTFDSHLTHMRRWACKGDPDPTHIRLTFDSHLTHMRRWACEGDPDLTHIRLTFDSQMLLCFSSEVWMLRAVLGRAAASAVDLPRPVVGPSGVQGAERQIAHLIIKPSTSEEKYDTCCLTFCILPLETDSNFVAPWWRYLGDRP